MRVIIVDDNHDAADALSILLRMCGHEVMTEYDGNAAVQTALKFKPEVVISDIGMPEIDGYEVARRLRRCHECDRMKLIALTAWGRPEDVKRSAEAGFDHHFVKPADFRRLCEAASL